MRKIINSTYVTLDGVVENPQDWPELGGFGDQGYQLQDDLIQTCDALIMGRRTYEGFAPVWPTRSGDPVSDRINSMDKYVVSSTLRDPEWNNTTVVDVDAIRGLKGQDGANIVQYGFGQLTRALMADGLLDELRLWIHPFFVGSGTAEDTLHRGGVSARFDLADVTRLDNGIVVLDYRTKA